MEKMIKATLWLLLFISVPFIGAGHAHAQISHISINKQEFTLGGYPKFRLNIVSWDTSLNKLQFIVRQTSGEERLMVQPINNFLLLATGVEDVVDPSATLVVKEYRVNQWLDVKVFPLFGGQQLAQERAVKPALSESSIDNRASKAPSSSYIISTNDSRYRIATKGPRTAKVTVGNEQQAAQSRHASLDQACTLNYTPEMTLWRIGYEHGEKWGISNYGAMLAIFEANPKAFNKGKINGLRADVSLRCPPQALRDKYSNPKLAKQMFQAL